MPDSPFSSRAAGTTGAAFLKLPAGVRAEGLGGAAAAGSEGAEALFWNPAGLARLKPERPSEVSLAYGSLLETSYSGSAAYLRPLGESGVLGAGLVYFSQSALTSYNGLGDPTGSFTPNDLALSLAYAHRLGGLRVAGALKLIRSSIADVSGTMAAADLGVQALRVSEAGDGPIDVGGSVSNLGPAIKVGGVSSPLPLHARAGVLWHTTPAVSSSMDLNFPVDQDPYLSIGLEGALRQRTWKGFLRLGYNQARTRSIDGLSGISGGAGLDLGRMRFDYAWVPFGDLGLTNRFSLAFRF